MVWLTLACSDPSTLEANASRHARRPAQDRPMELVQVGRDGRGEERSFYVHVPEGPGPKPAVFVFHGGTGSDARDVARYWMDQLDKGMILVFPNGQLRDRSVGGFYAESTERHQVQNVMRIVDQVVRDYGADPNRLYAAGFSGGAEMVDQLACYAPTTFRAYGHLGRTMLKDWYEACPDGTDRPQIMMLGTADDRAPIGGKRDTDGSWRQPPASEVWDFWMKRAGCAGEPRVETLPDRGDRAEIEVKTWTSCSRAAGMRFVTMKGVGHTWPDGTEVKDIRATDAFLSFFREFGGL